MTDTNSQVLRTALHGWHLDHGARMGPFAGYDMPIRYEPGTIAEHHHTRTNASLFDVSHMGVAELHLIGDAAGEFGVVAAAIERFVPCDVDLLLPGRQRYTQLLNANGGIIDDLIISRSKGEPHQLTIVSNAGRKAVVFELLAAELPPTVQLVVRNDLSLVALQGPLAETVLARLCVHPDQLTAMKFMDVESIQMELPNGSSLSVAVSRSGYTGEDGFEVAVANHSVVAFAEALSNQPEVLPAGLGARDTLRLEAGLCLYGNDIDETTSPVEAGLKWSIQKRRRESLGFPGAQRIANELLVGATRLLVGLSPLGKTPVREHTILFADTESSTPIGEVTSGGFSPTLGRPVAVGYIDQSVAAAEDGILYADVRGNRLPVAITPMPFVPHNYQR